MTFRRLLELKRRLEPLAACLRDAGLSDWNATWYAALLMNSGGPAKLESLRAKPHVWGVIPEVVDLAMCARVHLERRLGARATLQDLCELVKRSTAAVMPKVPEGQ